MFERDRLKRKEKKRKEKKRKEKKRKEKKRKEKKRKAISPDLSEDWSNYKHCRNRVNIAMRA
jgi:hypothetical protein